MRGTGLLAGPFSMATGMEGVRQVLLIGLAPAELVRDANSTGIPWGSRPGTRRC
jgi:hypothetical protein